MNQVLKLSKFCSSKYPLANTEARTTHFTGKEDQPQLCGEYWFLVPPVSAVLDKNRPDHQVLLLVDKEQYNTQSEVSSKKNNLSRFDKGRKTQTKYENESISAKNDLILFCLPTSQTLPTSLS